MSNQEHYDIESHESSSITFDFRGYLFKVLNLWKFVVACIGIALVIAYLINVRKQNVYRLESLVSVENDQNPFFTANTSISFNWGGVSGKMGKTITTLQTRTHNEKVVDSLQSYMNYFVEGKYRKVDIYKKAPFVFNLDLQKPQILGHYIGIRFLDANTFELFAQFEQPQATVQRYDTKTKSRVDLPQGDFTKQYKIGQKINLPFLNGSLTWRNKSKTAQTGKEFFILFSNYDSVVHGYKQTIGVAPFNASSSVIKLVLTGSNKAKIVDYLNTTAVILSKNELERKNLYATNTIKFIDSSLAAVDIDLQDVNKEMNDFRKKNKVFDVSAEMAEASSKLQAFEAQKEAENTKLNYLQSLEQYLKTKTNYINIAAPTSVGIDETNILNSVSKITNLAIERQNLEYTTREGSDLFLDLDRQIDAEKNVLLETIDATKTTIRLQLNTINRNIAALEAKLSNLPEDQQQYLRIQRKLTISQEAYNVYMAKRSEAAIVKAANISDISIVDEAKDIGGGLIGPNKSLNYMMALMMGFFIPMFIIFVVFLLDNTIHGSDEIERLSSIPILGLIGKYRYHNNLVVFEKPKSAVAESFRAIRSSLQFILNKDESEQGKTIMITSSVSGEGKTFCSINIATVYALSGKKTILLGLDLRKPKIFDDFHMTNDHGVVNYLIGEKTFDEVNNHTHVDNLDVIPSGPIPPNPSELLMSNRMKELMTYLRQNYDIIILDTPPLGLVTDALELVKYADTSIFMVRLDYTKKGMLQLINAKHHGGEIKNINFVLNFYKHKTNHNYGYGYDYGYGYGYGVYGNAYHADAKKSVFQRIKSFIKKT